MIHVDAFDLFASGVAQLAFRFLSGRAEVWVLDGNQSRNVFDVPGATTAVECLEALGGLEQTDDVRAVRAVRRRVEACLGLQRAQ